MLKTLEKKNKLISQHLFIIINNLIKINKNNIITITKIITKQDLSQSTIYISTLNERKNIIKTLNKLSKKIKTELSKKISNFKIPNIIFIEDNTQEYEIYITTLLKKI